MPRLDMKRLSPVSFCLLWLTLALLPSYVVRFSLIGLPLTLVEVLALMTVGLWLIELAWARRWPYWPDGPWLVAAGLLVFGASLGVIVSPDLRAALGIYKAYIIEPLLIWLVAVDHLRAKPPRWRWLVAAVALAAAHVIVLTWMQHFWAWPVFSLAEHIQGRATAVYNTANAVGLFVAPIILVLAPWLWPRSRPGQLSWLAILALVLGGIGAMWWSRSDGALVGFLSGVAVIGLGLLIQTLKLSDRLRPYTGWLAAVMIGMYCLMVLGYVWWFNHPPTVANPYTRPGFSTLTVRQCTWEGTVAGLTDSPVTGFGLAGFSSRYLDTATCDAEPLVYPHSHILNFWVEVGVIGLIGMVLVSWLWLKQTMTAAFDDGPRAWLALGLLAAMVYWLVHGLVDVPYWKNDLSLLWWALAALVVGLKSTSSSSAKN